MSWLFVVLSIAEAAIQMVDGFHLQSLQLDCSCVVVVHMYHPQLSTRVHNIIEY